MVGIQPDAPLPRGLAERGYRFCHAFRVPYRDIDQQGQVFNANYMAYIDYAFTEYFRYLGFPWREMEKYEFDVAVVRAVLDFRAPALLDDVLYVGAQATRLGNSSFDVRYCIWRDDEPDGTVILEAQLTYVNYDARTRRSRPIPPVIREAIGRVEGRIPGT